MDDRLESFVRGLIPGQKIAVYPLSTRYRDISGDEKSLIALNKLNDR